MTPIDLATLSLSSSGVPQIDDQALTKLVESNRTKDVTVKSTNAYRCQNGNCDGTTNTQQCNNTRSCDNSSNSFACQFPKEEN